MQFFQHAQFVAYVAVKFAAEAVTVSRQDKRKISRAASNQLRFRDRRVADFLPTGIAGFVTADDVKEVEHVPTFVEFLDGKNCPDAIVSIFERVQQKLVLLFLAFLVDRQAEIFVKLSFEPFHELAICNTVLSKELKGALNNRDIRVIRG
jgi:hypothetical protein